MRPALLVLLATLLGLALAPYPQPPASASCVAPYLIDEGHLVLERGVAAEVEGRAFVDGCRDTQSCSGVPGCESCEWDDPEPTPYDAVVLRLRQHGHTWTLDTADAGSAAADHLGWVTWTVDLPAGVRPGPARLVADHAQPVEVRIR
jgi:hypothetical protein